MPADWTSWGDEHPPLPSSARRLLAREVGPLSPLPAVDVRQVQVRPSALEAAAAAALAGAVGADQVLTDDASRAWHAGGQSYVDLVRRRSGDTAEAPDAVVRPGSAADVAAVLAVAEQHDLAVVPWGGGTSVVGGLDALRGSHRAVVALDLTRMNRLLSVDEVSGTATFEPGITGPEAEQGLAPHGLRLGHVPQSWERATLGGYAVTRSAGQASTGIGRFDDLVVGATLVTPRGTLALPARSGSAAGPDLRRLVLGSEGTLGVVTEVVVRVRPLPEESRHEGWVARTWDDGLQALRALAQGDTGTPDVLRLSDPEETRVSLALGGSSASTRRALDAYLRARRAHGGCLVITGYDGSSRSVASRRGDTRRVLRAHGLVPLGRRAGASWLAHRFAGPRLRETLLDAGALAETLETAATWFALPGLYDAVRDALHRSLDRAVVGVHVSHVYPTGASLYATVIAGADGGRRVEQWQEAKRAVNAAIVAAGGTITHHHAVGTAHRDDVTVDLGGPLGVDLLRAVKATCDPAGVLNPGKLLPA